MKIKRFYRGVFFLFFLSSCKFYPPEFKSVDKVELLTSKGEERKLALGITIYNPNFYPIKIKRGASSFFIQKKKIGSASFKKTIKLKAKKENKIETNIEYKLEKSLLLKLTPILIKDSVEMKVKGNLKAGVFFFMKNNEVDYSQNINPRGFVKSLIK